MSVISSPRTSSSSSSPSSRITDVLQVLYNPRTSEAAKQMTLRRLDGLEGRHTPIPKRRSSPLPPPPPLGHSFERSASTSRVGADVSLNCRLAITEGVAPLSSTDTERRLSLSHTHNRSVPEGRRRVVFVDEWELAGHEQDTALQAERLLPTPTSDQSRKE